MDIAGDELQPMDQDHIDAFEVMDCKYIYIYIHYILILLEL